MAGHRIKIPDLDDIAFTGRNLSYGAFYLRKKYSRFLLISVIIGLLLFILMALIPFLIYNFSEPIIKMEEMPTYIEYYGIPQPPDESLEQLAKLAAPAPRPEEAPKVVDTVKPQEKPKEIQTEEPPKQSADTSGTGKGSTPDGTGPGEDTGIYTIIDVYPRFPGGDQARLYFLRVHTAYPPIALKSGIQGTVMVVFVIEKDGSITHVDIASGIGGGCNEEAIRVTKSMPPWDPGKRNGKPVRVMVRMPIVFRIPGK